MVQHKIITPSEQGLRQAKTRIQLHQCQQLVWCSADQQATLDRLVGFWLENPWRHRGLVALENTLEGKVYRFRTSNGARLPTLFLHWTHIF
jgi:hypothetical protein